MAYPRHLDPRSHTGDDYYDVDPYSRSAPRAEPRIDPRLDPRAYGGSPERDVPRRQKSRRHRQPSPDIVQEPEPRRRGGAPRYRDPSPPPTHSHSSSGGHRRQRSMPVRAPSPPGYPRDDPRDPYSRDRDHRPREYYPEHAAAGGARGSGGRHRRAPSPDDYDDGARRRRAASHSEPKHRSRGRDYPPNAYDYDDSPPPRHRRAASQSRGGPGYYDDHVPRRDPRDPRDPRSRGGYDRSPSPRGRRDAPPISRGGGRGGPAPRRSSMPATSKRKPKESSSSSAWWQSPLIIAGARTALTAGAQAAMKNKDDPSPWLGPKGAKVATAALGAAMVDGFMGKNKHNGGAAHQAMQQGVMFASDRLAKEAESRFEGRGSSHRRRH